MRLVVELAADEYENFASGREDVLVGVLAVAELRQGDGLLVCERRVSLVEGMSSLVAQKEGVTEGGPAIRAFLTPLTDGGEDAD